MDEIKWDAVQNGDLESLGIALLSSSTLRRVRALQEVREKNGTYFAITPCPWTVVADASLSTGVLVSNEA